MCDIEKWLDIRITYEKQDGEITWSLKCDDIVSDSITLSGKLIFSDRIVNILVDSYAMDVPVDLVITTKSEGVLAVEVIPNNPTLIDEELSDLLEEGEYYED